MDTVSNSTPFVRVYIWQHSVFQKRASGNFAVQSYLPGHASLETHSGGAKDEICYMSFWLPTRECCPETQSHFHSCYQIDDKYYKNKGIKDPECIKLPLDLEGIKKIQSAFEKFKQEPYGWTLSGSGVFRRSYESNCAGLSLYLLEKGGLGGFEGTQSFLRSVTAATISSYLFFSVSFFCFRRVVPLVNSFNDYSNFIRLYLLCMRESISAESALSKALPHALSLREAIGNKAPPDLIETAVKTVKEMATVIVGLEDAQQDFVSLSPLIDDDYHFLRGRILCACGTLFSPIALTATLIFLNQKIWIKTVTPADVKQHADGVKQHLESHTSFSVLKKHQWRVLGITAGAVTGFYLAKKWN